MKCTNDAFPLCREKVMGMPRIEIEFEFDMVFCFGIRLALYAVFPLGFTFSTLHDLLKVIVLYTSCFPFVRPSVVSL